LNYNKKKIHKRSDDVELSFFFFSFNFFFFFLKKNYGPFIHLLYRGAEVDVKRLPKRPAPPRFGRKLTDVQKASNTLA